MRLRILDASAARCIETALGLIALSLLLQGLSTLVWADPARTKAVLEFLYAGREAVLRALHVMALALLTIGLLPAKVPGSAVCVGWAAIACLIETVQYPVVMDRLLSWADVSLPPERAFDAVVGLLVNARFTWSEVAASVLGGGAAWAVVQLGVGQARACDGPLTVQENRRDE